MRSRAALILCDRLLVADSEVTDSEVTTLLRNFGPAQRGNRKHLCDRKPQSLP
jgi:hypothetical protein